jgi:excinuclease UvrABC nuclease subunit
MLKWSNLSPIDTAIISGLDEKPAVFRLSYKSADNQYYVFYISSAKNLKTDLKKLVTTTKDTCLLTHLSNLECYFKYSYLPDNINSEDAERALYEKFKPRCNLAVPEGQLIDINLS